MAKKDDDGKVGGVGATRRTAGIQQTEAVGEVSKVKATSGVAGVRGTKGVGAARGTRTMTLAEREALLRMVDEEADELFKTSGLSAGKKEAVKAAVKMALDAGILPADDDKSGKK